MMLRVFLPSADERAFVEVRIKLGGNDETMTRKDGLLTPYAVC